MELLKSQNIINTNFEEKKPEIAEYTEVKSNQ